MSFYRCHSNSDAKMPLSGLRSLPYRAMCSKLFSRSWQDIFERHLFFSRAFSFLAFNEISGDYLEFGCHQCRTFVMAYKESRRRWLTTRLWAFDSFQGLPAASGAKDWHPGWTPGAMAMSQEQFHQKCKRAGISESEYRVVPGFYNESLPGIGQGEEPQDVCLAYIDCDMYSSTREVLRFLMPRLKHGMIIAFDDWFTWSAKELSGEQMAFDECFQGQTLWRFHRYLPIGWHGVSFIVERISEKI
jgi:hypothetical protein